MNKRSLPCACALLLSCLLTAETSALATEAAYPVIREDTTRALTFAAEGENWQTFLLEVGSDVRAVDLSLIEADGDMDLYLRFGQPMAHYGEADHVADSLLSSEQLVLRREGAPRLRTGLYYLDVARLEPLPRSATLEVRFERGFDPALAREAPGAETVDDGEVNFRVKDDALFNLPFRVDTDRYYTIALEVPRRTTSILVEARGARADIDLFARHDALLENWERAPDFRADSVGWDEQLVLAGEGRFLPRGTYYLDVANVAQLPNIGPVEIWIDYNPEQIDPLPASSAPLEHIVPGEAVAAVLDRTRAQSARYAFEVPPGTRSIDIATSGATRDLDLFLAAGRPVSSYRLEGGGHDHRQVSARLDERLQIEAKPGQTLLPGLWYLDVASLTLDDQRVEFTLEVALDAALDRVAIDWAEALPRTDDPHWSPLERVLLATVEVGSEANAGSGTILSPDGLILTNYHLFTSEQGFQTEDIYISLTQDFRSAPRQLLRAEVLEADADLDLALLRVVSDVHGDPLPEDFALPFLEPATSEELRLGDDLFVAGFPSVGGNEERYSLSLTRGILSGFERDARGRLAWLKTDALINAGNSGGTLLTRDGLSFIGVPSMKIVLQNDTLGYCRPLDRLPAAWRAHFAGGVEQTLPPGAAQAGPPR
ncbi:MAG: trypsin-like peptidase domain-containing protein [Opitutales bacterium]